MGSGPCKGSESQFSRDSVGTRPGNTSCCGKGTDKARPFEPDRSILPSRSLRTQNGERIRFSKHPGGPVMNRMQQWRAISEMSVFHAFDATGARQKRRLCFINVGDSLKTQRLKAFGPVSDGGEAWSGSACAPAFHRPTCQAEPDDRHGNLPEHFTLRPPGHSTSPRKRE